ncbi:MAG: hypothetical protein WCC60_18405 [Ilumatobacteraceae bacterium]
MHRWPRLLGVLILTITGLVVAPFTWHSAGSRGNTAFAAAPGFTGVTPARLLDTRNGVGAPAAPVGPAGSINLQVTGRGGVPASGVTAVVLNVTAASPTATSYLTVWPTGAAQPNASNLNYVAGQTVPNLVIVKVGTGGQVSLFTRPVPCTCLRTSAVGMARAPSSPPSPPRVSWTLAPGQEASRVRPRALSTCSSPNAPEYRSTLRRW